MTNLPAAFFDPFFDKGQLVTPFYWGSHWPLARGKTTGYAIDERVSLTPCHNSIMSWAEEPPGARCDTAQFDTVDTLGRSKPMQVQTWAWLIGMSDASDQRLLEWATEFFDASLAGTSRVPGSSGESYVPERRAIRLVVDEKTVTIGLRPATVCVNPVFELSQRRSGWCTWSWTPAPSVQTNMPGTAERCGSTPRWLVQRNYDWCSTNNHATRRRTPMKNASASLHRFLQLQKPPHCNGRALDVASPWSSHRHGNDVAVVRQRQLGVCRAGRQGRCCSSFPTRIGKGPSSRPAKNICGMGLPNILRALRLLKAYPNYRFVLDQACYVKPFLERYPEEEAAFRQFVAEGRLAIVGGTDVMPDVNMPGGESFVRQMLYGKGYFRRKLGVDVTVGWQLDTFGHHAQMPQLLRSWADTDRSGFRGASPTPNTPADFLWEGIDGSRIPAFWYSYGSRLRIAEYLARVHAVHEGPV